MTVASVSGSTKTQRIPTEVGKGAAFNLAARVKNVTRDFPDDPEILIIREAPGTRAMWQG